MAFVEEERLLRTKHAVGYFPARAVDYVLRANNLSISQVDVITTGWDCELHESGALAAHFETINRQYSPAPIDIAYQQGRTDSLLASRQRGRLRMQLRSLFGDQELPPMDFLDHHLCHAVMAYFHSGFDETLVAVVDGSGEMATVTWWLGREGRLERISEVRTPHSLGWFYSAFTEYLGFSAYDGEYKVMGLAAYGQPHLKFREKLHQLIWYDGAGGVCSDPETLVMGEHSYANAFSDRLVEHLGLPPRSQAEELDEVHMALAYEVQFRLESIVQDMAQYWTQSTGVRRLCVAGGVGLNVKMNGNLLAKAVVDDLFVHPLSADTGMSVGSAMAREYCEGGLLPERLDHVSWGPHFSDEEIEKTLTTCKLDFEGPIDIAERASELLAAGQILGWVQGAIEGGPRALGNRSILADPRQVESRDRVNSVIKFREFWRPFCPSIAEDATDRYLEGAIRAPFMTIAFAATERAEKEIPAVVHVDGTARAQVVTPSANRLYHELIKCFERRTGVPALLNTSYNVKGEPIVSSPLDAVRTFAASGLDALAIGSFLVRKPIGRSRSDT